MRKQTMAATLLAGCLLAGLAPTAARATYPPATTWAASYPPTGYFHLPSAVAGAPAFYAGEGGGRCDLSNANCTLTDQRGTDVCVTGGEARDGCYGYMYGVKASVPSRSSDGPYSFYAVGIYPTVARAQTANRSKRDGSSRDEGGGAVPFQTIAQPLAANEWLRGKVIAGTTDTSCYTLGGVRYENVVMLARVVIHGTVTAAGDHRCAATYRWVARVLAALYPRAVAYVAHPQVSAGNDLSAVDWRNFAYPTSCSPHARPVTVTNGQGRVEGFFFQIYPPVYGDLTGDGRPEAVVPYSCTGADFGGARVFVFTGSAAHPKLLGTLPPHPGASGHISSVEAVSIRQGMLQISGIGYSATAAHCCPDLTITTRYRWNGHEFVAVGSTTTKRR